MLTVTVTAAQPFQSRVNRDTVLLLRFAYSVPVLTAIKHALKTYQAATGLKNQGGWLSDWRAWFVERGAWPTVRAALEQAGCRVQMAEVENAGC